MQARKRSPIVLRRGEFKKWTFCLWHALRSQMRSKAPLAKRSLQRCTLGYLVPLLWAVPREDTTQDHACRPCRIYCLQRTKTSWQHDSSKNNDGMHEKMLHVSSKSLTIREHSCHFAGLRSSNHMRQNWSIDHYTTIPRFQQKLKSYILHCLLVDRKTLELYIHCDVFFYRLLVCWEVWYTERLRLHSFRKVL